MGRPRTWTPEELRDAVEIRVSGCLRRVPRRVFNLMAGPVPPPEFESNGAGPSLGGSWVGRVLSLLIPDDVSFIGEGADAGLAAHFHDYAYSRARPLGGTWGSRRQADFLLARNILTVCAEAGCWSWPMCRWVASCYWVGVRFGGWIAFSWDLGWLPHGFFEHVQERSGLFRDRRALVLRTWP